PPASCHARHVVLRPPPGPVLHRLAGIDQEPRDEVRFLLVLLQVEAVGAAVDFPVDVLDVVARGVLAVLGELDGEPVPRAAVPAGEVALDHLPGLQLQAVDAGQNGGGGEGDGGPAGGGGDPRPTAPATTAVGRPGSG